MRMRRLLGMVLLALSLASPAFGNSVVSFNFAQHGNGNLGGSSSVFDAGPYSLTAYGFENQNHPEKLFFKNGSGDENGLGLLHGGPDHEIANSAFIEFSTSGITGNHLQDFLSVGSVQAGESWKIYGSNILGQRGLPILSGSFEGQINITTFATHYKYISLGAGSKDVLFSGLTVIAPVPEPGTLTLFGTGLVGLAGMIRRKLRR